VINRHHITFLRYSDTVITSSSDRRNKRQDYMENFVRKSLSKGGHLKDRGDARIIQKRLLTIRVMRM
jgi:hypothetical protein